MPRFKKILNIFAVVAIASYLGLFAYISNAEAATEENGFCKYDINNTTKELNSTTVDYTKISVEGIIIGVTDINKCPLPGKQFGPFNNKNLGSEFLFSGVMCVVQSVISKAMFQVYCNILYWVKDAVAGAIVLYIMLYGLAIMFDLGNNPVRNAPKNFLKLVIIYLVAANSMVAYNWIYKSFLVFMNGFVTILSEAVIYDSQGRPIQDMDGNGLLLDGRKFVKGSSDPYLGNIVNLRYPAQQYYYDGTTFLPVFAEKELCPFLQKVLEYHKKDKKADGSTLDPAVYLDCPNLKYVDVLDAAGNYTGPARCYKDGTCPAVAPGCNLETERAKCRVPFNGVIGMLDSMFKNIVGNDQGKGLMGLAAALGSISIGGGPVLAMLLFSGIMAMLFAFFNLIFSFVTAMMGVTFLFMLTPIFIPFALFTATFDYFKRWLSTIISFIMQPVLILLFLMVLGSAASEVKLLDLVGNTDEARDTTDLGSGISFDRLITKFKEPVFRLPDDPYFADPNNFKRGIVSMVASPGGGTSVDPDRVATISFKVLRSWHQQKLETIKLKYILENFVQRKIINGGPYNGVTVEFSTKTSGDTYALEEYAAAGSMIVNEWNAEVPTSLTVTTASGTKETVSKAKLARVLLSQITKDEEFEQVFREKGLKGLFDTYNTGSPPFKTLYLNEIEKKLYDGGNSNDPAKLKCFENCPMDNTGKMIYPFTTDRAAIASCDRSKGGCNIFTPPNDEDTKYFIKQILLFLLYGLSTATFVSLIPNLCTKLTHWSPGAGATGGAGGAPAIFGNSKRYLANDLYSSKEQGEMHHLGSVFGIGGIDGTGRSGAVLATLDKAIGVVSGKPHEKTLQTMLNEGAPALIERVKAQNYQLSKNEIEAEIRRNFEGRGYSLQEIEEMIRVATDNAAWEKDSRFEERARQPNQPGREPFTLLLQEKIDKGMYTDQQGIRDDVIEELYDRALQNIKDRSTSQTGGGQGGSGR